MTPNLTVDEVLTTTRAVRKRLDFDRPVPREVLMECLNLALQAPTGSNAQGWQWVFVEDPEKKKAIAEVYKAGLQWYSTMPRPEYPEGDVRAERAAAVTESALYLAEHIHEAPVLMIPCLRGNRELIENSASGMSASFWGSLFPAMWSYCLALRSRGLGTCWTTFTLIGEGEHQVADLLGIPFESYLQGGLFPIGYTKGTEFKPAKRLPAEQLTHWDSW